MLTRFHSVVVDVADFDAAVRDYALLLGRAPILAGPSSSHGSRRARFSLSNAQLELRDLAAASLQPVTSPAAPALAGEPVLPLRAEGGIAGIRFCCTPTPGARLRPGRIEGPTVPIELVSEPVSPAASPDPDEPRLGSSAACEIGLSDIDPAAQVAGLDHVVVASPDPERTRRYLADDLGIRLALDRSFAERGLRLIFFRLGGVTLEVASALGQTTAVAGRDAFHGLAWKVVRIESVHARLRAVGLDVSEIRPGHKAGTRVASLRRSVHGVPTLLIEHPPRATGAHPG
jgi:catechol 2,3-dioxygenase-like lactoylglutathione lyase family enzyme